MAARKRSPIEPAPIPPHILDAEHLSNAQKKAFAKVKRAEARDEAKSDEKKAAKKKAAE